MDRLNKTTAAKASSEDACAGREACVARSLMTAANLLNRIGDRLSASIGLTSSRWLMLCTVSRFEEAPSVGALSEEALLSVQNVSRMLGQMEADGLIERFTKPGSGRAVFVRLTAQGESALEQTRELADEVESWFLRGFTEAEVARIDADLWRMSDNLRAMEDAQAEGETDAPAMKGRSS